MTTAVDPRSRTSACDGVTTQFNCQQFISNSELQVYLLDAADAENADGTLLVEGVDYTITGVGRAGLAKVNTGIAFPAGKWLRRYRVTGRAQTNDYIFNDGFPSDSQELALDRASLIDQEQDDDIQAQAAALAAEVIARAQESARALRVSEGQTVDAIDITAFIGKFMAFNADGQPTPSDGTGGGDAALRGDLAGDAGLSLIGYRPIGTQTYKRSNAQLKKMGGTDTGGINLIHYIDPALDAALLAGTNVTPLDTAFANAQADLAAVQALTGWRLKLNLPRVKLLTALALSFSVPQMTVDGAFAARIDSTFDGMTFGFAGDGMRAHGVHFHQGATGADPAPYAEISAPNSDISHNTWTRDALAHIPMYVRGTATNGRFSDNDANWYGGLNIISDLSNYSITGNRFKDPNPLASDDGIAIKAIGAGSRNIFIAFNYFENKADFVGIGSEIGVFGTTDPTYSHSVRGVIIFGNWGKNCSRMVMIKPGGVDGVDYRDGLVDSIVISCNVLIDETGANFLNLILIQPGRGAKVMNVGGERNVFIGRSKIGGSNPYTFMIYLRNDGTGTAAVDVRNVDVAFIHSDPFNGVANGVLVNGVAAPGAPIPSAISLQKANPSFGTVSNISLEVRANGTSLDGVSVAAGFADWEITVYIRGTNINVNGSSSQGGVQTSSKILCSPQNSISVANGFPYKINSGGDAICPELSAEITMFNSDVAAGTPKTSYPWAAKRRCQLVGIKLGTNNTVTPDDTNYTRLDFKNKSGTDVVFFTARTKVTPVGGNDIAFAPVAGTRTSVFAWSQLTLDSQRLQTLFTEGQTLHVDKIEAGTGGALNDSRASVHALAY